LFHVDGGGFAATLRATGFDLTLAKPGAQAVGLQLVGANAAAAVSTGVAGGGNGFFQKLEALPSKNARPSYNHVVYSNVYPGIDLAYDPAPRHRLEYSFT